MNDDEEQLRARVTELELELAAFRKAKSRGRIGDLASPDSDEWCTPSWLLDIVRSFSLSGEIALDPCWNDKATTRPRARFTREDDGLKQDWSAAVDGVHRADLAASPHAQRGVTFVNPPYSDMRGWSRKVRREAASPLEIVSLIKVDTSTLSWSSMVWRSAAAVAFFYKRLRHDAATERDADAIDGTGKFASALVMHGFRTLDFRRVMAPHAAVVVLR